MPIALPIRALRNPTEWKCAAMVALVFFVASLTFALALTRDQKTSEINAKTLKAAAAIKISRRQPLRVTD
jgi:antibiotic biosynthesis monooxygenase (ABM) superfamily enzyme